MHEFSTVDGFVEIVEPLAEMIKYVANEPSVGLFYVQQHTQNAVPNVINLKNNVVERSRQTNLHTEDLEDSITMMRSMKECGFPIADEMIRGIRKSLALMSTRKPRRGLIDNRSSGFLPVRTRSWGPASWANSRPCAQHDTKGGSYYFSTVLKTAREKAGNFQWPQPDAKEVTPSEGDKLVSYPTPSLLVESASTSSSVPDVEIDELPLSSQAANELQMPDEDEQPHIKAQPDTVLFVPEDYDDFKADKEVKLEEWLGETGDNVDKSLKST